MHPLFTIPLPAMEKILIIDFGSQYTQLIARRVRELNVYCEIHPFHHFPAPDQDVKGIILSGSPYSVYDAHFADIDLDALLGKYPILGICYGAQLIAKKLGGNVMRSQKREYGRAMVHLLMTDDPFLKDVKEDAQVWMSHADTISAIPHNFELIANSGTIDIAAYKSNKGAYDKPVYCLQFHPEVIHSTEGKKLLQNFCVSIAGCRQDWTPDSFVESAIATIKKQVGDEHVMLALSGGVDSTVVAGLLHRAIGKNLFCFFVNNGLLRKNEFQQVLKTYEQMGLNIDGVDAGKRFLDALKGISDPEEKRKIIGEQFIRVFEEESRKLDHIKWLAQGTIYPDVIESAGGKTKKAHAIKSHHNVGGLPETLNLKLLEPLRELFKDEVREFGVALGLPHEMVYRHPFPGPGLGVRILGEVKQEFADLLRRADAIFIDELRAADWYDKTSQAFAVFLPVKSVGVMGDGRTYEYVVSLRAVETTDFMTAHWSPLPYDLLGRVSNRIINEVRGINRVVYDVSSKPPATIEWE